MNEPVSLEAGSLRITFVWQLDRYAHRIDWRASDSANWQPLLESVEGTPDDSWPSSPPLTGLHIEQRPGGERVALLVGLAGTSHWSAAITVRPQLEQLHFDLACRTRTRPTFLGSTYRPLPAWSAVQHGIALVPSSSNSQRDPSSPQLVIATASQDGPFPQTLQWAYQLSPTRR